MIIRIWHGWVAQANASAYQQMLEHEIFKEIEEKEIPGFLGIQLGSYLHDDLVEFVTIMRFETLNAIIDFAGTDYKKAYIPDKAKQFLIKYDHEVSHYTLLFPQH